MYTKQIIDIIISDFVFEKFGLEEEDYIYSFEGARKYFYLEIFKDREFSNLFFKLDTLL